MTRPDDDPPRLIGGRYRLSTLLGSGAMGTVWSAYDEVLQRRVAVKELKIPPGVPAQEALDMRERIMREARALGGLSHPNVITVFDVVVVDDAPVVVLEMVPSRDLAMLIGDNGFLTVQQAAVIGFTTAGALRAAHRSGITHRDVKPGNVLVADDGRVKLTDFGIARNIADAPMTSAGLVLGSPAYIAPEVAAGQPVTPAADLWGLGATLFAAVEGRPPYDVQGDPVRTITEVVDGEVPRPRSTGPVAEVISALMVKDPDARMPLEEVRRRLRPLILDPDDPVYPGSPDAPTLAAPITRLPRGVRPAAAPSPSLVKTDRPDGRQPRPGPGGRADGGHPNAGRPDQGRPDPNRSDLSRSDSSRSDQGVDQGRADQGRADGGRTDGGRTDGGRPDPGRAGGPQPKQTRTGAAARSGSPAPASAPLASSPGPLPGGIRPSAEPDPGMRNAPARPAAGAPSGWVAAALVVVGAAVVLAGIAAGWVATRTAAGESPWTTVNVTANP